VAQQPLVGQDLLIIEASPSLSHTTLDSTPLDGWWARHRGLYLLTFRHTTLGRTPLDGCPARHRGLYPLALGHITLTRTPLYGWSAQHRGFYLLTLRHITLSRTPLYGWLARHRGLYRLTLDRTFLNEWSARRRNLYLTKYNTHKRQASLLPPGFEPAIAASGNPQTHALDRAAPGSGNSEHTAFFLK
jgi:hypothetical protein